MNRNLFLVGFSLFLSNTADSSWSQSISECKQLLDGVPVVAEGSVTYLDGPHAYVEAFDRTQGIRVRGFTVGAQIGQVAAAVGTMSTTNGERVIDRASLYPSDEFAPLRPLCMPNSSLGGSWFGYQDGVWDRKPILVEPGIYEWVWVPASGLNTTGLFVKTFGTVTQANYSPTNGCRWLHIDDGSAVVSDLGNSGVLVYSDAPVRKGDFVAVTGICATEAGLDDPTRLIRVLRPRDAADVQVVRQKPEQEYPFSDEFNEPVLDPRWAYRLGNGAMSITSNPGWLKLLMPETRPLKPGENGPPAGPEVIQRVGDYWTLEVRGRPDFSPSSTAEQSVAVMLAHYPGTPTTWLAELGMRPGREKYVRLGWGFEFPVDRDDCVFRMSRAGGTVYVETENPPNSATVTLPAGAYSSRLRFLSVSTYSYNPNPCWKPFAVYCDYFRVTVPQD